MGEFARQNVNLVLPVITVTGLLLRFLFLDSKSVWLDEAFSYYASTREVSRIPSYISLNDNHPPLFYLVLHLFLMFGQSEFLLRLPSAIFGALTIPVAYLIGKKVFNPYVGLTSSLLLAISPMHIYYSQEARNYLLFGFFSSLSVFFYLNLFDEDPKLRYVIGYVGATVLCLYTHYYGFLLLAFEVPYFVVIRLRQRSAILFRRNVPSLAAFFVTSLLFVPWIPFALQQPWMRGERFLVDVTAYSTNIAPLLLKYPILFNDMSVFWPSENRFFGLASHTASLVRGLFLLIFFILFVAGLWRCLRKSIREHAIIIILPLVTSTLIISLVFLCEIKIWHSKSFLFLVPFFLITISEGFAELRRKRLSLLLLALTIFACAYNIPYNYSREVEDWRGVVTFVDANWREGDVIIFDREFAQGAFTYYVDQQHLHYLKMGGADAAFCSRRVWLVLSHTDPAHSNIKADLDERFVQRDYRGFRGVHVYLYEVHASNQ